MSCQAVRVPPQSKMTAWTVGWSSGTDHPHDVVDEVVGRDLLAAA